MIPNDPDSLGALAGEYVLGTLEADEAAEVAGALDSNAALRRAVIAWEERLHPLSALAPERAPPADLWPAIAARLPAAVTARPSRALGLWRAAALAATAIAASLAGYILLRPQPAPGPDYVALLHAPRSESAAWIATASRGGLQLTPIAPYPAPASRDLELWVIPAGSKVPRAVGLIPAGGRFAAGTPSGLGAGALLAVSVEPKGGSPTGLPTGPVVLVGEVRGS